MNRNIKKSPFFAVLLSCLTLQAQKIVTVEEAMSLALENNYGIKIAYNSLSVSANNADLLNSGYLPTLTANGGATFNRDNAEAQFANGETTVLTGANSSRYNASLNLNYTLFDGFGRKYDYQAFKEQQLLSELEVRETIENTTIQLYSIYLNVAQFEENVASLKEALTISKKRLLRARYMSGYGQGSALEVLNAEVDINNDSIAVLNAVLQLENAKRDLNLVLGNVLEDTFKVDTSINFLTNLDRQTLSETAKTKNVALLKIEQDLAISELSIKSNKSAYLPTVGLVGSYGWNRNNNNAASFVAASTNVGLSGGVTLSWNIFDGGRTITQVNNSKIGLETQRLQKENTLLELQRDFDNAWFNYKNKYAIYLFQDQNIKTAQNNFERTEQRFKSGQTNSIEFRQAQINLLNAQVNKDQAKYEAKFAELQLLQISGDLLNVKI